MQDHKLRLNTFQDIEMLFHDNRFKLEVNNKISRKAFNICK